MASKLMIYYEKMGMKIDDLWYEGRLSQDARETYENYRIENVDHFNFADISLYFLRHGFIDLNEVVNRL